MLIVTGAIVAREGAFDALYDAARAHVARSRSEPGCIGHAVYRDPEDALRLFFFERWTDRAALDTHFATEGAATLLTAVRTCAAGKPELDVYEVKD